MPIWRFALSWRRSRTKCDTTLPPGLPFPNVLTAAAPLRRLAAAFQAALQAALLIHAVQHLVVAITLLLVSCSILSSCSCRSTMARSAFFQRYTAVRAPPPRARERLLQRRLLLLQQQDVSLQAVARDVAPSSASDLQLCLAQGGLEGAGPRLRILHIDVELLELVLQGLVLFRGLLVGRLELGLRHLELLDAGGQLRSVSLRRYLVRFVPIEKGLEGKG